MNEPNPLRPFDYIDYAEQFHNAFHELRPQHPPLSWPRYFLLCHSIELALKSYLALYGATPEQLKRDFGHKLDDLVIEAVNMDLRLTKKTRDLIKLLNEAHTQFRHRYPGEGPVYIIEQFIPAAKELLSEVRTAIYGGPLES